MPTANLNVYALANTERMFMNATPKKGFEICVILPRGTEANIGVASTNVKQG
jgi:hypothetical protein